MPGLKNNKNSRFVKWFYGYIDDRLKVDDFVRYMSGKVVPRHRLSLFYYLGGLTLFFFLVQVATGLLLLMYYRPGAETAYESVRFIVSEVSFGWLIKSMHSWSANLMILAAFIHMFTVYFTQSYRRPREITWLTGIALLILAMAFGFSGYLLPWNELSYFATRVGTGMAGAIPVIGKYLLTVMRGGEDVTGATIGRFFGLHVAILPALFVSVVFVHLLFVQRQGVSEPISWSEKPAPEKKFMRFFPNFLYRDLLVWLLALNLLALLSVVFPDGIGPVHWPLGDKADPFSPPPPVIRPEWYFMFVFQALKMLPAHIWFMEGELFGIILFAVGSIIWALVPFIDKKSHVNKVSRMYVGFGAFVLTFIIVMTFLGYIME